MLHSPVVSKLRVFIAFVVAASTLTAAGAGWFTASGARALGQSAIPLDVIPIYAIQGAGVATPLFEAWVDTYGVVTGVTDTGFYLQDPVGDDNPATSDGLFVYTRTRPDVVAGECVAVTRAYVDEFYDKTELSRSSRPQLVDYCAVTSVAPSDVEAAQPGIDPVTRFEHVEGMVVRVDDITGTVQGATKRFGNGDVEIAFLPDPWADEAPGGRVFQADAAQMQGLMYLSGSFGATLPELNWGDRIGLGAAPGDADAVLAVLDYNFGKYQLIPLPDQAITATVVARQPDGPIIAPPSADELTVCTTNLWGLGRGSDQHPDAADYALHLQKRALAIATNLGGCTIIALQEAGAPDDVENLAAVLRASYGLDYAPTAIAGPGTRSAEFPLTNGLLTRRERVTVTAATPAQGCSATDYGVAPVLAACAPGSYPLFNRPPLVVDLLVEGVWAEPYPLTVISNHWKSKGGDETVNVVRRTAQAAHVATLVQARLDADPAARVLVTGDLNDYYASGPVETLREDVTPELVHLYDMLPPMDRYTYIFNGGSQVLDHMIATSNLAADVAALEPVRINADYAYPAAIDLGTVYHASDHDPVALTLRPGAAAWVGGNLRVPAMGVELRDEGDIILAESRTDALGDFRLWRVPPGTYTLTLTPPPQVQVEPASRAITVTVGAGTTVTATVRHRAATVAAAAASLAPLVNEESKDAP